MIAFDKRWAVYVLAVVSEIGGRVKPQHLTDVCPECDERQTYGYNDAHLVVPLPGGGVAVIVGCEGAFVVDPRLVGIDAPNRMPLPAEQDAIDRAEAAGRAAYAAGRPAAPGADETVLALIAGNPIGTPATLDIMRAFTRGRDAAADEAAAAVLAGPAL